VVNSHAEPFGLTIVEAMASGTPVLATAVDGIKEIIRHDQSGCLVKPGDHHALVEALDQLILDSELRRSLSSNALAQAHERFHSDRFLREIENLYRNVLERRVTPRVEQLETKLSAD
jgi:glycosyltransferase involved in cell wall biosynthesis